MEFPIANIWFSIISVEEVKAQKCGEWKTCPGIAESIFDGAE